MTGSISIENLEMFCDLSYEICYDHLHMRAFVQDEVPVHDLTVYEYFLMAYELGT